MAPLLHRLADEHIAFCGQRLHLGPQTLNLVSGLVAEECGWIIDVPPPKRQRRKN